MKNWITTTLLSLAFAASMVGQEPVFTAVVSLDSVLLGNRLELTFKLENTQDGEIVLPDLEGFNLLAGPNYSSMMSMVNGAVTQSKSYTYILEPKDIGNYFIPPVSVMVDDKFLETLPIEIVVFPNPDGIIQETPRKEMNSWFFDYQPPLFQEKKPQSKPKRKRKIYKI